MTGRAVADNATVPPQRSSSRVNRPSWQPTLLDDLVRDALDPAYVQTAARRRAAGATAPRQGNRPWLVLPALLGAGLLIAVAAHRQSVQAPAASRARAALVADVVRRSDADAALARKLDELRRDNATLREQALRSSREGERLTAELRALEPAVGLSTVRGPGLAVRLADATALRTPAPGRPAAGPEAGRVLDRDLQDVVNALWAAGAEAVAVGGVRLTSTTAIRTAGQTILVDFRPLTSPYAVVALGEPGRLQRGLAASPVGRRLRAFRDTYGLGFGASRIRDAALPAATVTVPRQARP